MTYGRGLLADHTSNLDGAVESHLAELVRGDFLANKEGPLIRPSATFSPRGEGKSVTRSKTGRTNSRTPRPFGRGAP